MSVLSSRVSSVSSLLKNSGVKAQFIKQPSKVCKLPTNVRDILCNFEKGDGIKEYRKLIKSLNEDVIKDSDLAEFLANVRQNTSLLSVDDRYVSFVQALLYMKWVNRSPEVISTYKLFLLDLACMQTVYLDSITNCLVRLFKPEADYNSGYEVGELKDEDVERLNHIHDVLRKLLGVMPMLNDVLRQTLKSQYPFFGHGTYTHKIYIYALLEISVYAPQLRRYILTLIISSLMTLDVNIPYEEAKSEKEDVIDDCISDDETTDNDTLAKVNNDTDTRKDVCPTARKLDSCIELLFKYMHEFCFVNDTLQIENLKTLYDEILDAFEAVIFTTHASQYVQYIMFYICSFRQSRFSTIVEEFTKWLWRKVNNPNMPPIYRQTAVCYISSLHATASFISPRLVEVTMSNLTKWIHEYITSQENSGYIDDFVRSHSVFYSVCQAFFHLFIARHEHFIESKDGKLFLQNLNMSKIVTCRLNPLKVCDANIVQNFADITRTYQLAYCHAVIENNNRNRLPIFGIKTYMPGLVPNFFPFESYKLEHSGQRIIPLFCNNVASTNCQSVKKSQPTTHFWNENLHAWFRP